MRQQARKKLLFLPGFTPRQGLMSGPVYLRMYEYLGGVFETHCGIYDGDAEHIPGVVPIPYRQWWWPPSRIANIHTDLRARYLARALRLRPTDTVLAAYPFDGMSIAHRLKTLVGTPYHVVVHDMHRDVSADHLTPLKGASSLQCASQSLVDAMRGHNANVALLYPTPGKDLGLTPEFRQGAFGVAGGFNARHIAILSRFDCPVLMLGDPVEGASASNIAYAPRFRDNDDAIRFISGRCSAFCVVVPHGEGDYELHSFPSRLIDFCRAGLPIIVIASRQSSVGRWAIEQNWPLHIDDQDDRAQFEAVRKKLADRATWALLQQRVQGLAAGDFSYNGINAKLLETLAASV